MNIICISGKAGHGKDTLAGVLEEKLTQKGERVLITHYADLLKWMCEKLFGWDGVKDEAGRPASVCGNKCYQKTESGLLGRICCKRAEALSRRMGLCAHS